MFVLQAMKKFLYAFSCCVFMLCFAFIASNEASAASKAIYDARLDGSKEEILSAISKYSADASDLEALIGVGHALLQRPDFTAEDYISLILDAEKPLNLRYLAIECYAKKLPASGVNDAVVAFIADRKAEPELRTIAVAMLGSHLDVRNEVHLSALLSAVESADETLAYNALKVLEHVYPERAVVIAQEIYDDFKNESPARINIAAKVLARHYASEKFNKMNAEEERMFREQSLEIYNSIANAEIKSVISGILTLLADQYTQKYDLAALHLLHKGDSI